MELNLYVHLHLSIHWSYYGKIVSDALIYNRLDITFCYGTQLILSLQFFQVIWHVFLCGFEQKIYKIIPLNDEKKYNPNILLPWTVLDIYANTNFFGYYLYKDEYDDDVANNHLYFLGPLVKLYCTLTCSSARFMKICAV